MTHLHKLALTYCLFTILERLVLTPVEPNRTMFGKFEVMINGIMVLDLQ